VVCEDSLVHHVAGPVPLRFSYAIIGLTIVAVVAVVALVRCTTGAPLVASIPGGWWGFGLVLAVGGLLLAASAGWLGHHSFASDRLGKYQLEERIGVGGMGEVYRATHRYLRRPTAVKLLPPEKVNDRTRARFEREVQRTALLQHPNTISIYDHGRSRTGVFYYAMELVPGLSLTQLVGESGPLPIARVIHILRQVCGSLAEAHDAGLVHRDIKPSNIMVARWGGVWDFVKVVDFGLVKVQDTPADVQLTKSRVLLGTPEYLAPEAILTPQEVDHRADLYGVGAVGSYLLTGRPVFGGDKTKEVLAQHLGQRPPRPLPDATDEVGQELQDLILACLAKTPDLRPASASIMEQRLEGLSRLAPWSQEDAEAWWRARPGGES
jgi:serine/threonine protein kinase